MGCHVLIAEIQTDRFSCEKERKRRPHPPFILFLWFSLSLISPVLPCVRLWSMFMLHNVSWLSRGVSAGGIDPSHAMLVGHVELLSCWLSAGGRRFSLRLHVKPRLPNVRSMCEQSHRKCSGNWSPFPLYATAPKKWVRNGVLSYKKRGRLYFRLWCSMWPSGATPTALWVW